MFRLIVLAVIIFLIIQYLKKQLQNTPQQQTSTSRDAYAILSLRRGASKEEIKKAYRAKLSENHPDKVSHLSTEIQETARNKTNEIQWAYEQLK